MLTTPPHGCLIHHESGYAHPDWQEELTRWRWARKQFEIAPSWAGNEGQLWLLLSSPVEPVELELWWNGGRLTSPSVTVNAGSMFWAKVDVPGSLVRAGSNLLELRAENAAMTGWGLALEPCSAPAASWVSFDRGASWQNEAMTPSHALRGEFVARLRLGGAGPTADCEITYEERDHPRVCELRERVPAGVAAQAHPWWQVLGLRSWVARQWPYQNRGHLYAPWDAWTIPAWAGGTHRYGARDAVTMCVHYAAAMTSFASALGHRARCAAVTPGAHSTTGHFVCEIFDQETQRWVMHDANYDMHFEDERPLSLVDLADRSAADIDCTALACRGPGAPDADSWLDQVGQEHFFTGKSYRYVAVWRRNHFISHPPAAPPAHGKAPYCETDLVWYTPDPASREATAMFPYQISDRAFFERRPI